MRLTEICLGIREVFVKVQNVSDEGHESESSVARLHFTEVICQCLPALIRK